MSILFTRLAVEFFARLFSAGISWAAGSSGQGGVESSSGGEGLWSLLSPRYYLENYHLLLMVVLVVLIWYYLRLARQGDIDRMRIPSHQPLRLDWEEAELLRENQREMTNASALLNGSFPGVKSIYVTSCYLGDGKTNAALQLAHALALGGRKNVLLVDAHGEDQELGRIYGMERAPGYIDFLAGAQAGEVIQPTGTPNLFFMPFGNGAHAGQAISHASKGSRFKSLRDAFDYVVADGQPIFDRPQTATKAAAFDGVVLVADCETTKLQVARAALEKLGVQGAKLLGVVLNRRRYYIPGFLYRRF